MPWARLDDSFWRNTKVGHVSNDALAVNLCAISYCAGELTDGVVSPKIVQVLCLMRNVEPEAACRELVDAGLWEDRGDNSYQIHDFLKYNPSREQVLEDREEARKRQEDWRRRQKEFAEKRNGISNAVTNASPNLRPGPGPGPVPGPGSPDPEIHGARKRAVAGATDGAAEPARKGEIPHAEQVTALLDGFGHELASLTSGERGKLFDAAKQLHGAHRARDDILTAIRNWPKVYPRATITYHGVAANITRLLEQGGPRANGYHKPTGEPIRQRYLEGDGRITDADGHIISVEGAD